MSSNINGNVPRCVANRKPASKQTSSADIVNSQAHYTDPVSSEIEDAIFPNYEYNKKMPFSI